MTDAFADRSVTVTEDGEPVVFRYRLLEPPQGISGASRPPGGKVPVVLFLHGAGERGSDNEQQLKYLPTWLAEPAARERYPCFLVAPQCRSDHRWVEVAWNDRASTPQAAIPTTDMAAAVAALEATLALEAADPRRVFLTGLSMGGFGAWDLAARMPERFAALLPICGGGDERTAPRLVDLPVWCFHGDADTAVPVERSRRMIAALEAAGGSLKYSELPDVGHDSWTPAYRDPAVLDWLFRQSR
jgi:predicted peptidase